MTYWFVARDPRFTGSHRLGIPALILFALLLLPLLSGAQTPNLTAEQEQMANTIFNELISPCCWTTTVAHHGSGPAPRIQAEVRGMIAEGMTHQEILDHYVEEYGERILAKPKKKGFNLAAYWVPYVALLIGAVVIILVVRRGGGRRRRPAGQAGPPSQPVPGSDEEYHRKIEEELRRSS